MARDVGQLYSVARAVLDPLFSFLWHIEVEGLDRLPESGGAIMAPNHLSVIDHFVLATALPRRITYVGKGEYMDSWKTKYLFPALGMIPIDRSGGSAAQAALDAAAGVLGHGELFGIYPEGTRSRDGKLHKGHTGAARLALRTGCPIYPVGLQGTLEVQPPDASMPKPFKVMRVRIGRPVSVARYRDRADDRMVLRQIIDEVMFEIRELSGQEYVDSYSTKKSEELPAETAVVGASNGHRRRTANGSANGHADVTTNGGASPARESVEAAESASGQGSAPR
jgi:1-acyl-sn-glycerol-3-phosphate acyltransferase